MDLKTLFEPLVRNVFWLKLVGVFSVVYGVVLCITIVGIVVGWVFIWLGVLLFQAAMELQAFSASERDTDAVLAIEKLARFFKIEGILGVVGFAVTVLSWLSIFIFR